MWLGVAAALGYTLRAMIIVTGTKRSGTSMWMQILKAAGFAIVGEACPRDWASTIREGNPLGFYESPLRRGAPFLATKLFRFVRLLQRTCLEFQAVRDASCDKNEASFVRRAAQLAPQ